MEDIIVIDGESLKKNKCKEDKNRFDKVIFKLSQRI